MDISTYCKLGRYFELTRELDKRTATGTPKHPLYMACTDMGDFLERSESDKIEDVRRYLYLEQKFFEHNPGLEKWYRDSQDGIDKLIYMYSTDPTTFKDQITELHEVGYRTYASLLSPATMNRMTAFANVGKLWGEYTGKTYSYSVYGDRVLIETWDGPNVWCVCPDRGVLLLSANKQNELLKMAQDQFLNGVRSVSRTTIRSNHLYQHD